MATSKTILVVLPLTGARGAAALCAAAALAACIEVPVPVPVEADPASLGAGLVIDAGTSDCGGTSAPRLDLSLDRTAITTELATSNAITVTLQAAGGFGGAVTLSGSLSSGGGAAPAGWAITFDAATVTVPVNGVATTIARVVIPSENHGLSATAHIAAASSATVGTFAADASVTALNQITFGIGIAGGLCAYPAPSPGTVTASIGTKLRWLNLPTSTINISIHTDSNPYGVFHQATSPGSAPGIAYEATLTGTPGAAFRWYCHAPGPVVNNYIQPVN